MAYQEKPLVSVKTRHFLRKLLPVSLYLRHLGRHDHVSAKIWRAIAAQVPAELAILDVGAFTGEFAIGAREVNKVSEIYAFEPNPESIDILVPACKAKRIEVVDKALSDKNETVHFNCNSKASSITDNASDSIKVDAVTLDSWIEEKNITPYLIKIDVEDAAKAMLEGAKSTVNKHRPVMLCEILKDEIGDKAMSILPDDYHFYLINENKGLELKKTVKRYDWRYLNWMLVPKEKLYLIQEFSAR